jgi:hypothetical protein
VYTTAAVGVLAGAAMLAAYVLLETLRPKMTAFEPLSPGQEGLVNYVGVGLLLTLVFCVMALAGIVHYSVREQRILPLHLLVVAGGLLTLFFVFADAALIGDIGKQYKHGFSQPEWGILYAVMAFQLMAMAGLLYAVVFTLPDGRSVTAAARDHTVHVLAQVVGVVSGGIGLTLTLLNFFYPRPLWMVQGQIVPTMVVVLVPYAVTVGVWVIVKLRERGEWFDEKQRQDVGAAAFASMVVGVAGMGALYFATLDDLQGMVSVLWFPAYVFLVLLVFSAVNLFRARESLS